MFLITLTTNDNKHSIRTWSRRMKVSLFAYPVPLRAQDTFRGAATAAETCACCTTGTGIRECGTFSTSFTLSYTGALERSEHNQCHCCCCCHWCCAPVHLAQYVSHATISNAVVVLLLPQSYFSATSCEHANPLEEVLYGALTHETRAVGHAS